MDSPRQVTRRDLWRLGSGLAAQTVLRGFDLSNQSYPLRMLDGSVTPPNLFFVRDHFDQPDVSIDAWRLRIEGQVRRPYEINFSDLVELPSVKLEAFLECAGNGANGSAIGNGLWEGVPLRTLLEAAEPLEKAGSVQLEGADSGRLFPDRSLSAYSQIVPLVACRAPSALLSYKYNEFTLPVRNGFPARAVFPGLYGMNSVKWLRRITVLRANEQGTLYERSGMDRLYNRVRADAAGREQITRVATVQVKSAFAWPAKDASLPAGHYSVWGFAWSGAGAVRKVAVSFDNGKSWTPAKVQAQKSQHAWVRWQYEWDAKPGDYALMSCAEDAAGAKQPLTRDAARKDGYELNWCAPIRCSIR